jgi:hypothetical protein
MQDKWMRVMEAVNHIEDPKVRTAFRELILALEGKSIHTLAKRTTQNYVSDSLMLGIGFGCCVLGVAFHYIALAALEGTTAHPVFLDFYESILRLEKAAFGVGVGLLLLGGGLFLYRRLKGFWDGRNAVQNRLHTDDD